MAPCRESAGGAGHGPWVPAVWSPHDHPRLRDGRFAEKPTVALNDQVTAGVLAAAEADHNDLPLSLGVLSPAPSDMEVPLEPTPTMGWTRDQEIEAKVEANRLLSNALITRMGADDELREWAESDPRRTPNEAIENGVRRVIDSWAADSNNRVISEAVQEAVNRKFGPGLCCYNDGALEYHHEDEDGWDDDDDDFDFDDSNVTWVGDADPFLDAYVDEQYRITQEWLEVRGITEVTAHRGMSWGVSPDDEDLIIDNDWPHHGAGDAIRHAEDHSIGDAWFDGPSIVSTDANALSSWTTRPAVARGFGNHANEHGRWGAQGVGAIVSSRVPADRVFSVPRVGPGCLNEHEVVLIGGPATASCRWKVVHG